MPCGNCVDKFAYKLLSHHPKLDLLRAYELADKAVERVENRDVKTPVIKSGNPTDYTQSCVKYGSCSCRLVVSACATKASTCACKCPSALLHSHLVTSHCGTWLPTCGAPTVCPCSCQGTCSSSQVCDYDCDTGYVWNPVTLQCELSITETINAKTFPMQYLATPVTANELISTVSGATISLVSKDFPKELIKSGKAKELKSKWS